MGEDNVYKLIFIIIVLLVTGCATTDTKWLQETHGNQFEVISGRVNKGRYVEVDNKLRTWNGPYLGGKERIDDRKLLLTALAEEEASRVCGDVGFLGDDTAYFNMKDTNGSVYGGGLIGEFIAFATAKKENIPISIHYKFICTDEENASEKLTKRV